MHMVLIFNFPQGYYKLINTRPAITQSISYRQLFLTGKATVKVKSVYSKSVKKIKGEGRALQTQYIPFSPLPYKTCLGKKSIRDIAPYTNPFSFSLSIDLFCISHISWETPLRVFFARRLNIRTSKIRQIIYKKNLPKTLSHCKFNRFYDFFSHLK